MRRVPIGATIVVALAALLMVRLGFWQLHRLHEKEALIARFHANLAGPTVPLSSLTPVTEAALYRRVTARCPLVRGWIAEAGRDARGQVGWRHIASCGTGAEGPRLRIDVGLSQDARPPRWAGGAVTGRLTFATPNRPLVAQLFAAAPPPTPLVVSEAAAPGLVLTARPDPAAVPNNHLSYAIQWFFFAATAVAIYGIALRRRSVAGGGPRR